MSHTHITSLFSAKEKFILNSLIDQDKGKQFFDKLLYFARASYDFTDLFDYQSILYYARLQMSIHLPARVGYIYATSHPLVPDKVKIGLTKRDPAIRIGELTTAGIPGKFILHTAVTALDSFYVESKIHQFLDEFHFEREIFNISIKEALLAINLFAEEDNQILSRRLEQVMPMMVIPNYQME